MVGMSTGPCLQPQGSGQRAARFRVWLCESLVSPRSQPHNWVAIAPVSHLFPSRTEKLSPVAPMVLRCNAGEQEAAHFFQQRESPLEHKPRRGLLASIGGEGGAVGRIGADIFLSFAKRVDAREDGFSLGENAWKCCFFAHFCFLYVKNVVSDMFFVKFFPFVLSFTKKKFNFVTGDAKVPHKPGGCHNLCGMEAG